MVKVYVMEVSELLDPIEYPECMDGLTENRKEKILRYKQRINRKQSLGAGLLLRQIFDEYNLKLDDLCYGENGKPEVKGLYFNLSHSDEMVVCAVGEKPVGCDIEKIGEFREGVATRYFSKRENEYLSQFDCYTKRDEFYRLWTMKESYLKMTGEGMSLSLDRLEFVLDEEVKVLRDEELCFCRIKEYQIPRYKLSVCAEDLNFDNNLVIMRC